MYSIPSQTLKRAVRCGIAEAMPVLETACSDFLGSRTAHGLFNVLEASPVRGTKVWKSEMRAFFLIGRRSSRMAINRYALPFGIMLLG